jgi:hypothetical protein
LLGSSKEPWDYTQLLGVGTFLEDTEKGIDECDRYGFPRNDVQDTPVAAQAMPLGFGVQLTWQGEL